MPKQFSIVYSFFFLVCIPINFTDVYFYILHAIGGCVASAAVVAFVLLLSSLYLRFTNSRSGSFELSLRAKCIHFLEEISFLCKFYDWETRKNKSLQKN